MKEIRIFTDGACRGNQGRENTGGYGAVLLYKDAKKEIFGGSRNTTNNIMELTAVIEGLRQIREKNVSVIIFADSAYVVNAFEQDWIGSWKKNGWKNSSKKPVENQELWKELVELVESFEKVSFRKIKGHLKKDAKDFREWYSKYCKIDQVSPEEYEKLISYNELADALANKGADAVEEQ